MLAVVLFEFGDAVFSAFCFVADVTVSLPLADREMAGTAIISVRMIMA